MPDIKTREIAKGTVKAIDKSAVAAEPTKQSIKTVEHSGETIKQTAKSTGKAIVKTAKGTRSRLPPPRQCAGGRYNGRFQKGDSKRYFLADESNIFPDRNQDRGSDYRNRRRSREYCGIHLYRYTNITVSHKTAGEMANQYNFSADQRKQLAELLADENRSMWSAVLYGIGTGDGEIVTVALSQIGNVGGEPYWSWYGFNSRVEWCACFVSWCANECGYIDAGVIPKFAGCVWGVEWFRDRGLWQDNRYEPRPR